MERIAMRQEERDELDWLKRASTATARIFPRPLADARGSVPYASHGTATDRERQSTVSCGHGTREGRTAMSRWEPRRVESFNGRPR
jgi:hypothetical protein